MKEFFPIGEFVDRLIISQIKAEKLGLVTNESQWYESKAKELDLTSVQEEILQLEQAHLRIWEMEKLLKSGLEDQLPLDEIGRRAIKIRNLNGERIVIKNALSKKLGCEVVEIKKDHLSELQ